MQHSNPRTDGRRIDLAALPFSVALLAVLLFASLADNPQWQPLLALVAAVTVAELWRLARQEGPLAWDTITSRLALGALLSGTVANHGGAPGWLTNVTFVAAGALLVLALAAMVHEAGRTPS